MRTIKTESIIDAVQNICMEANYMLDESIEKAICASIESEKSSIGKEILGKLLQNAAIAREKHMAICQDTGMAVLFVDVGQDLRIEGSSLTQALNEGVRRGYASGYLRNSVINDPLLRVNTGDNTPAVIHYEITDGDRLDITIAPKGFGSENMSAVKMLKPSDGIDGVRAFVVKTVSEAGPNACPPMIVGVGVGGTMEKAALLAKKALLRPLGVHNPLKHAAALETELLFEINRLGIGPSGFGGTTTALGVNLELFATHIAGLPVAVNIGCHVTRHANVSL